MFGYVSEYHLFDAAPDNKAEEGRICSRGAHRQHNHVGPTGKDATNRLVRWDDDDDDGEEVGDPC